MKNHDSRSRATVLVCDLARAVSRTVIDENEQIRRSALPRHRCKKGRETPFLVEERRDDDDHHRTLAANCWRGPGRWNIRAEVSQTAQRSGARTSLRSCCPSEHELG